jgi:methylenetetrahydrofolate dehydrogenase (NADP+)/methenyltetrahydrofolate cyclohydrolase
MSDAALIDGAHHAAQILEYTKQRAAAFEAAHGRKPSLATILVGDDPASVTYVAMKQRRCAENNIESLHVHLPQTTTTAALVEVVSGLSEDPAIDGILLQHPVPSHIDERAGFEAIIPAKDVDGVTMHSFAAMAFGYETLASCTPAGIMRLLSIYDVDLTGKHAVVIGRSAILGKPVGMLLLQQNATVTYCHSRTRELEDIVATADVLVAAVGRPNFVRGAWLKPGVVVIDAGYNEGNVGDVHFAEALERASLITPVPGGVGPMTIAMLLEQTVDAALARSQSEFFPSLKRDRPKIPNYR